MRFVTYNIHYAIGWDGVEDIARIAEAVRGADVIALQEVERHYGPGDPPDQPEALAELLPEYYWVYGPAFDVDASTRDLDGKLHSVKVAGQQLIQAPKLRTAAAYLKLH